MILLCAATRVEARACEAGLLAAGPHTRERFEVLTTGMGYAHADKALRKRLEERALTRPELIVSTGFAGAWTAGLTPGQWLHGLSLRKSEGAAPIALPAPGDPGLAELTQRWRETSRGADFITVTAAETRPVTAKGAAPDRAAGTKAPWAVDMESYAWFALARGQDIPFMILRMVSDTPESPLPGAVGSFAQATISGGLRERAIWIARGSAQAVASPWALGQFVLRSAARPARLAEFWGRAATATATAARVS